MPELPDVEALRRLLLAQGLVGRRFQDVDLRWPRAVRTPPPQVFLRLLPGREIHSLGRRGKFLLLRLEGDLSLIVHLRMTGLLRLAPAGEDHPHLRNAFPLDDGRSLWFLDPRKLGCLWLVEREEDVLAGLGPEPLADDLSPHPHFTEDVLARRLKGQRGPIKAVLLKQSVIAGIGNIYADEVLFAAGLHPTVPANAFTPEQVRALHRAIPRVLAEATRRLAPVLPGAQGPPTESVEGKSTLTVPREEGAPCPACGTLVRRLVLRGRSAYFCPSCQPSG